MNMQTYVSKQRFIIIVTCKWHKIYIGLQKLLNKGEFISDRSS
jgi:hypothetical protein